METYGLSFANIGRKIEGPFLKANKQHTFGTDIVVCSNINRQY